MDIQQIHYTSCRYGTAGYAGFQVRAASEGIDPADLESVVRHSHYKRPLDWSEGRALPVCYRFYKVPSGRIALSVTRYAGTDYSNREGNLFSHTLLCPPGSLGSTPTDYFSWSGWKKALAPGEDEAPPGPLSLLAASAVEHRRVFADDSLKSFLQQRNDRIQRLGSLIRAAFFTSETGRALVVRTEPEDALWWMALVHRCFPRSVAEAIDFSSYEYAQMGLPLLTATVAGTELTCDAIQRDYQFYCFDELTGQDSALSAESDFAQAYADRVLRHFHERPDALDEMLTFAESCGCAAIDRDLDLATALFELRLASSAADDIDHVRALARFALDKAPDARWFEILRWFEPMRGTLARQDPELDIALLARSARLDTDDARGLQGALQAAWLALFERELRTDAPAGSADRTRSLLLAVLPDAPRRLAAVIADRHQAFAEIALLGEFQLRCTLEALEQALTVLQRRPLLEQPELQAWLGYVSEHSPGLMLSILPALLSKAQTTETFLDICGLVGMMNPESSELADSFVRILADHERAFPPEALPTLRRELPLAMILAEWQARIDSAADPLEACLDYRTSIADRLPHIAFLDYAPWLAERLRLHMEDSATLLRVARHFFDRNELALLRPDLACRLIDALGSTIPLAPDPNGDPTFQEKLEQVIAKLDLQTALSKTVLTDIIRQAQDPEQEYPTKQLLRERERIAALDERDYWYLIDQLLIAITPRRLPQVSHVDLAEVLYRQKNDAFPKRYRAQLEQVVSGAKPADVGLFVAKWIASGSQSDSDSSRRESGKAAKVIALRVLSGYSERDFAEASKPLQRLSTVPAVASFLGRLDRKRNGIVARLGKAARSLLKREH